MSTNHTIRAEIEVRFHLSGAPDDERETAYPTVDIDFTYVRGAPATWTDPGYGAEIEVVRATLVNGDGLAPTAEQVDAWAEIWLQDAGYDRDCVDFPF